MLKYSWLSKDLGRYILNCNGSMAYLIKRERETSLDIIHKSKSLISKSLTCWSQCSNYIKNIQIVKSMYLYNNVTSVCIFIGCWPWSIKGHTQMSNPRQIHVISRQRTCFSFFMPPNPSINHLNFYCTKQTDNIFPCVCTVIEHRRRHSV